MPQTPVRYTSADEDSGRWTGFPFRAGDIVISTRSKSGTTWMQMICALLIFRTPDLPAPLNELSPWVDWLVVPRGEMLDRLGEQRHRRFVKTHTPLDGIPLDRRATYVVVARHPLDMAVSLYHQSGNLDRERIARLTGASTPDGPAEPRPPLHDWLLRWIDDDADPRAEMDSLPGVMRHLSDAWRRRRQPNVLLVHYDDLSADLGGEMGRIAAALGEPEPDRTLVEAATFASMKANADRITPDPGGILKDRRAFFRRGRSGNGREVLSADELEHYRSRTAAMAPPDLLAWLHRDR